MSNGYLLAAEANLAGVREIANGFGLEAIGATTLGSQTETAAALSGASNVGIVVGPEATRDAAFVALLRALSASLRAAQLILTTPDARDAFPFLPESWPAMLLEEARSRSAELVRRRAEQEGGAAEPPRAQPLPQIREAPPAPHAEEAPPPVEEALPPPPIREETLAPPAEEAPEVPRDDSTGGEWEDEESDAMLDSEIADEAPDGDSFGAGNDALGRERAITGEFPIDEDVATEPRPRTGEFPIDEDISTQPGPRTREFPIDEDVPTGARRRTGEYPIDRDIPSGAMAPSPLATAPADATAFAPKKLRRGSPELIRIAIHQPKDLKAVIKAARKIDPRTDPAPSGMKIGDVALGASVGVSLDVRGAACAGEIQRRTWQGNALDFNFSVEADEDVKQAVFLARVFVDDAQIGVLAFTRPVGGAHKAAHATGDSVRLKRHKRVFISYSSADRETVAAIATAYQAAGVEHFFDRTSLKSGEEWSPRLRKEIDKADLFHLCWSKAASASEWVEKETEHALDRRRANGKKPEITVQMLDGPPWAPHPKHLDSINFDDFVRAAIVGYARGDGGT